MRRLRKPKGLTYLRVFLVRQQKTQVDEVSTITKSAVPEPEKNSAEKSVGEDDSQKEASNQGAPAPDSSQPSSTAAVTSQDAPASSDVSKSTQKTD